MFAFAAFAAGLVFGLGLLVSGMANPAKILGFLDLAGKWDPSLPLVMVGANAIAAVAFVVAGRRTETLLHRPLQLTTNREIDARLVGGSLLFGIGWGIAGFCPGPALVALGALQLKAFVFAGAMVGGMLLYEGIELLRAKPAPSIS